MKRAAIVAVMVFILGIVISSCNRDVCPAYSQNDAEQAENVG